VPAENVTGTAGPVGAPASSAGSISTSSGCAVSTGTHAGGRSPHVRSTLRPASGQRATTSAVRASSSRRFTSARADTRRAGAPSRSASVKAVPCRSSPNGPVTKAIAPSVVTSSMASGAPSRVAA
jgi:hypothetical protein